MTPKQEAWAIQAEHVIKQMERRHFNAYYCSTKEEALTKALSIIEKGSVIASGGSATLGEVGLLDYIKNHSEDYTFIDRSIAKTEDEKRQIHAKAILSDYYKRIRQDACPPNCVRLGLTNPCSKTGICGECMSASSICDLFVTTRMSRYPDRIHVIMVGEELGY